MRYALLIAVAMSLTPASQAGGPVNAWRELKPEVRKALQSTLTELPYWKKDDFVEWYAKWYCLAAAGKKFTDLPIAGCPDARELTPEYYYNHCLELNSRIAAACVTTKLLEDFPTYPLEPPGLGPVLGVSDSAVIVFQLTGKDEKQQRSFATALRATLKKAGYTEHNGAAWFHEWGLRSDKHGPQLHFGSSPKTPERINVHIDLWNPGKADGDALPGTNVTIAGVEHYIRDDRERSENYTPENILSSHTDGCGVGPSDLGAVALHAVGVAKHHVQQLIRLRNCK